MRPERARKSGRLPDSVHFGSPHDAENVEASYRHHRPTGQAVVTIGGRDIYLGRHGSAASKQEYKRLVAEAMANGGTLPVKQTGGTIAELPAAFLKHARGYHSDNRQEHFRLAMRPLKELYGRTPVADFGPLALKAVRQQMIDTGLARTTINQRIT